MSRLYCITTCSSRHEWNTLLLTAVHVPEFRLLVDNIRGGEQLDNLKENSGALNCHNLNLKGNSGANRHLIAIVFNEFDFQLISYIYFNKVQS